MYSKPGKKASRLKNNKNIPLLIFNFGFPLFSEVYVSAESNFGSAEVVPWGVRVLGLSVEQTPKLRSLQAENLDLLTSWSTLQRL